MSGFLDGLSDRVLEVLLCDRSTGGNILWACDDYEWAGFSAGCEMSLGSVGLVVPRLFKDAGVQAGRSKGEGEVFTPSWVCNLQNNLVDEAWFGCSNVFNTVCGKGWVASGGKIVFPGVASRSWQDYVLENRLEITCGEAPYLVSRYDTTTGEVIPLKERIGLLDRKLRVVGENTESEEDWLKWSRRAFEATYGFEFQGDSLLVARVNFLQSFRDYVRAVWGREPSEGELLGFAEVVSYNLWQMDGLTGFPPFVSGVSRGGSSLFDLVDGGSGVSRSCVIMDWGKGELVSFNGLLSTC